MACVYRTRFSRRRTVFGRLLFSGRRVHRARRGRCRSVRRLRRLPSLFPAPIDCWKSATSRSMAIWQIVLENEKTWRDETQMRSDLDRIWEVMQACVQRGLETEGVLPGGLNVRRRAPRLARKLTEQGGADPLAPMDWVNVYAMAVNEENAAGGRVVTAPTNGAAGIIPAVAHYYRAVRRGRVGRGVVSLLPDGWGDRHPL